MKRFYALFFIVLFASMSVSAQVVWDNFQDVRKGTYGFISGGLTPYFGNPDATGSNTSLTVAKYDRNSAEEFDVIILDGPMADLADYLSGTKQMSIDVWSPAAGTTVQITLESTATAEPGNFPTGRHSVYLATTTVAEAWETLKFTFNNQPDDTVPNTNVDRIVLLFNPGSFTGDTYYFDNLNGPEFATDPCADAVPDAAVLEDFECNQNLNYTFSHAGVNFRRVINPDMMGNMSQYVAEYTRNGGEETDVIVASLDGNLSLNANNTMTLDVWDPGAPTTVRVSLQTATNNVILAMDAATTGSSAWETLTFDPSSVADDPNIAQIVILFDPGNFTGDKYFFDNLALTGTVNVEELTNITSFVAAPNPTQGLTNFQYELASAAQVQLSIQDITGKVVDVLVNENQPAGAHQLDWIANDLTNGIYFYTLSVDGNIATGKIVLNR